MAACEVAGFEAVGEGVAPGGHGDAVDARGFGGVDRLVAFEVGLVQVEIGLAFVVGGEGECVGTKPVFAAIPCEALALPSSVCGAVGFRTILARCLGLRLGSGDRGGHRKTPAGHSMQE